VKLEKFRGSIISIHSGDRGLFYVIKSNRIDSFLRMQEFEFLEPINSFQQIKFGDIFIYKDPKTGSQSRAYRLHSCSANKSGIKAFLFDVGQMIHVNFAEGQFFDIPRNFLTASAMGIFCQLDEFPESDEFVSQETFLEGNLCREFDFHVKRCVKRTNALGNSEACLLVDILSTDMKGPEQVLKPPKEEKSVEKVKERVELSFINTSNDHMPFPAQFVFKHTDLPAPGTKLLIKILHVFSPSSFYVNYHLKESLNDHDLPELFHLEMLINNPDVVDSHENLPSPPVVGEMVLAKGGNNRFSRGYVKSIVDDRYLVSAN
jgi:hypothetical protein